MKKVLVFFLVFVFSITQVCFAQDAKNDELINSATRFLTTYKLYSENFDPKLINLYADDASIEMVKIYPDNQSKVIFVKGDQIKKLLNLALPIAKEKGEVDKYYDETYSVLDESKVQIDCTRYSVLKEYESPHIIVIKSDGTGNFKIVYEKMTNL